MRKRAYMALDMGASGGRAIAGCIEKGRLTLHEVHRFDNNPIVKEGRTLWDVDSIFGGMCEGISLAQHSFELVTAGIDTWGVDYSVVSGAGNPLTPPIHYRDARAEEAIREVYSIVPEEEVYRRTGIIQQPFNTLARLYSQRKSLDGGKLLFMPCLLGHMFTGVMSAERTVASTGQMLSLTTGGWDTGLMKALGIPTDILIGLSEPGTALGPVMGKVLRERSIKPLNIVTVASHDTASAVAAAPLTDGSAYISSGTWSLLGIGSDTPILSDDAREAGYTNEAGAFGGVRFLKNIMGLWIIQELRREWAGEGKRFSYAELAALAGQGRPLRAFIDPDDGRFYSPGDMEGKVRSFLSETGQAAPESIGEVARAVYESLALKYRYALDKLEQITGKKIDTIIVVGGGSRNEMLNRYTAEAAGRVVLAGPAEATAAGNILVQALAAGDIGGQSEIHEIIQRSSPPAVYEPQGGTQWEEAYGRFRKIIKR